MASAGLGAAPLHAQNGEEGQEAAVADAPRAVQGVEVITVTARRRAESVQDVPVSIIAFGERQIEALNATSLTDLNRAMPNVNISDRGGITIRGIQSNTRNAGFEAGAAVYIDGVYQGRPIGNNQDLTDIDRIEVLRGPQGTLYGKNTTAGAISLVTVRPGDTFTGNVDVQYAERNDIRVSGYVAGPLAEGLAGLKLAGFRRSSDGHQVNLADDGRYGDADSYGGRAELRLTPGEWDFAFRADAVQDDGTPVMPTAVAGFAAGFADGRDTVHHDVSARFTRRGGGVSLTAERDFLGHAFTSISGWRTLRATETADDDYSPLDIVHHSFSDRSRQFSQEVRLASTSAGRLSYVVGAYYFNQDLRSHRPVILGMDFPVQDTLVNDVEVGTEAYAVFANADYQLADRLVLNLGLRYTRERKTLDFVQDGIPLIGYPNLTLTDSFTDNDLSPTLSLTYQIAPNVSAYGRVSRGYKSGGWNPDITTTDDIRFGPENVTNYEAGLRTRLLDDRLIVNLTGYYMDYKDLQVLQFLGTFAGMGITNAGVATIQGAELDVQARPFSWLNLSGGAAYTDAVYDRFDSGTGGSYAGQQITNTPKFTGFVAFDARFAVAGGADLVVQGDYSYQSRIYFDDDRTVAAGLAYASDGHGMLNGRVGVITPNNLEFYVFGDNLTDERALRNRMSDNLDLGLVLDTYAPPRRFGTRLGYKF